MSDILCEPTLPGLINAIETNQLAHAYLFSRLSGTLLWNEPDLFGMLTNLDPSESFIYRTHFSPSEADARIEQVLQRFREYGCLPMHWQVSPSTRPKNLGKYLEAHGFKFLVRVPGMVVRLQDLAYHYPAADQFNVDEVTNDVQLRLWARILGAVDGISSAFEEGLITLFNNPISNEYGINRLFLGSAYGEPVAISRFFGFAGVAGIWQVATLPEARGHGYGTKMTMATAKVGLALGYHFGVLLASPAGVGLYHRLGFQEICHIDVYKSDG